MSFGKSPMFKTTHCSGSTGNRATHKVGRQHVSPRYCDDRFEHVEHSQPNLRKLVQLLAITIPELVEQAQTELKDNTTFTSSTITEDKELKRRNEDLRKQNEKLELTLLQQGKLETDIAILQTQKAELETRLAHEIRRNSELTRIYKDDIYNLQHTINKQKKEIYKLNTAANEIQWLKAELATKEERDTSLKMKHDSYDGLDRECQKLRDELKVTKAELETKLDFEIRRKSELTRTYEDEINNLQHTINTQKKEIDDMNKTTAYEIRKLKAELAMKEERGASLKMKHGSYDGLDRECQKLRDELKVTKAELDDTKTRLSKSMGDKLTYNNPNIADLSDQNRPTKLAERFQEIYDNQWTDAFELLDEINKNEETTISALTTILADTMLYCEKEAEKQVIQMKEALTQTSAMTAKELPQNVKKQINDMRKAVAEYSGQNIYQLYERTLRKSTSSNASNAILVPEFVEACFTVCWLMTVQDPPVVFGPHIEAGEAFNSDMYRAYTKSGSKVEFVVWPALCLHKGGALLCKGVAQGYGKDTRRRTKSAPPDGRKRNKDILETHPDNCEAAVKVPSHDTHVTRDTQTLDYRHGAYSRDSREAEHRNQADRYGSGRGMSYHQTTTVTKPSPTYTPKNLDQYERYSSRNPTPSQKDMDNYLWYNEYLGKEGARHAMGTKYDMVVKYLKS